MSKDYAVCPGGLLLLLTLFFQGDRGEAALRTVEYIHSLWKIETWEAFSSGHFPGRLCGLSFPSHPLDTHEKIVSDREECGNEEEGQSGCEEESPDD